MNHITVTYHHKYCRVYVHIPHAYDLHFRIKKPVLVLDMHVNKL